MTKVKTKEVNITVEYAKELLERNSKNQRPLRQYHVKRLSTIMKNGDWQPLNGDTIVVDTDNRVIDGQYRLNAVIDSGCVITTLLVTGVSPEAYYSIDLQGKTRNMSDVLAIEGYKNANKLAASLKLIWLYRRGICGYYGFWKTPSTQELERVLKEDEDAIVRSVKFSSTANKVLSPGPAGFLHFIFSEKDPGQADKFFRALASGIGFTKRDPVRLLRDRLMADKGAKAKLRTHDKLGLAVVAWNSVRKGTGLGTLRWNSKNGKAVIPEVI